MEKKDEKKIKEKKITNSEDYLNEEIAKRKKVIKYSSIIVLIIVLLIICTVLLGLINMTTSKIIKGVTIDGIDVSGLSKEQARQLLEEKTEIRETSIVKLKYQDFEKDLAMEELAVETDIETAIDKASKIGRDGNLFQNNITAIMSNFKKTNVDLEVTINEESLEKFLTDAGQELPGVVKEYTYSIEEEELLITPGTDGIILNKDQMKNEIITDIKNINNDFPLEREILVKDQKAKEIDLDEIYNEVHTEPQDASIIEEPFEIIVDKNGIDFAITMEEAKALLAEEKEEYLIPLKITKASITVADLGSKAFPDKLSGFTTRYDAGNINRSTNLSVACQKINNYVLQPGETFSYNQTLGKRTVENGFREAHIFTASGVEDGLGGGICQISSTLYNTVVLANLEIVERHNHSYTAGYVAPGRDATVSYGVLDFKFKNNRTYPIKISAYISGGVASVEIYGIKETNEPNVQIVATTTSTIPCAVQEIPDETLEEGQQVVTTAGMNGYTSVTYKYVTYPDGKSEKILLSNDRYATITKVVKVGTKAAETQQPAETPAAPSVDPVPETPVEPAPSTTPSPEVPAEPEG